MKKDTDVKILNMDDTTAMLSPEVPLTIKHCLHEALLNTNPAMTSEEKSKRWGLCQKMRKGGVINITNDEADLIRKASGEVHVTLIFGQIEEWLDKGNPKDKG